MKAIKLITETMMYYLITIALLLYIAEVGVDYYGDENMPNFVTVVLLSAVMSIFWGISKTNEDTK